MDATQPEGLSDSALVRLHLAITGGIVIRKHRKAAKKKYLRLWRLEHPNYNRDKQREYRARDAALRERGYL